MAAGDELIDDFDNIYVKNRVSDGPVEVMFNGHVQVWKPGETRAIKRAYEGHFISKSCILRDPTFQNPPVNLLVTVDLTGASTDPALPADPLTKAEVADISRYGILDESNLPDNRYVDDRNQPQNNRELRGVARGFDPIRRSLAPLPKEELAPVLDHVANSLIPA